MNLKKLYISSPVSELKLLSDTAANEFFYKFLSKQRDLDEVSIPSLGLKSATIKTLLNQVILRTPLDLSSEKETPPRGSRFRNDLQGCFKTLRILDISGNDLDDPDLESDYLLPIFDFLESLEVLNLERLKFSSFTAFKRNFILELVTDQDYKPYMNTLKKINLNIKSDNFYQEYSADGKMQMSYSTANKILDNILENFTNLKELKVDFMGNFIRRRRNRQDIRQ